MAALIHEDSVKTLIDLLEGASKTLTRSSSTAEELQEVLNSETYVVIRGPGGFTVEHPGKQRGHPW